MKALPFCVALLVLMFLLSTSTSAGEEPTAVPPVVSPTPDASGLSKREAEPNPAESASVIQGVQTSVSSRSGWQNTPLSLTAGARFEVTQISGSWTVDSRNFRYVGSLGYPSEEDAQISQGCKLVSTLPYGRLLGRVGGGAVFSVGAGGVFTADTSGVLALRINDGDSCLVDNDGSLLSSVASPPSGSTKVTFLPGQFTESDLWYVHTALASTPQAAICDGMSGVDPRQDRNAGKVGYLATGWGGLCGFYNAATSSNPDQVAQISSLVGAQFTASSAGYYRISADIEMHGAADGEAEAGAIDLLQEFIGPLIPLPYSIALDLADPAGNLAPSVASSKNSLTLKVDSTEKTSNDGFSSMAVTGGSWWLKFLFPKRGLGPYSGVQTVQRTMHLDAGQSIRIVAGLETEIKLWGNATATINTDGTIVKQIVVERR